MIFDDPEFQKLREKFVNGLPDRVDAMKNAFNEKDYETLSQHAHRLAGSAGLYELDKISSCCEKLEIAAKNCDATQSEALLLELTRELLSAASPK